ncbi:hypothetical protein SGFS_003780 [Streptomyces graminofaciens]|uniref:Uncharacterized protein n=1 Tax=Streptomyces graminofaciens TaxID=68212 RepID=A0ABM7F060_9ACTN|nr:hypothetical protein [Streptomyces graminofaciens]BBC29087.1 hypothetical protein SGFS_003780 [Streptomyces graminofaciens]
MGPLLTWAIRWIDDFADHVLAAGAERDAIDARPPAGPDLPTALAALLDDFRRRQHPLPAAPARLASGRRGAPFPSTSYLARLLGYPIHRLDEARPRQMIADAARDVGVDTDCPLAHAPQGQLDDRSWVKRISYYDVARLERLLQVTCWIVIAYLSGIRDSENGAELHLMQHSAGSK